MSSAPPSSSASPLLANSCCHAARCPILTVMMVAMVAAIDGRTMTMLENGHGAAHAHVEALPVIGRVMGPRIHACHQVAQEAGKAK